MLWRKWLDSLTHTRGGGRIMTVLGWSPTLRVPLGSRHLACGCAIGVYERMDGSPIAIIDVPGNDCPHAWHVENTPLDPVTEEPLHDDRPS